MTIDFYYASWSPPCRTVELVAYILKVKLNPIVTTPSKGDTQKPEYKQVPTIILTYNIYKLLLSAAVCVRHFFSNHSFLFGYVTVEPSAYDPDHRRQRFRFERKVSERDCHELRLRDSLL